MKEKFSVRGMSCAACVANVEKAVRTLDGVEDCAVSLITDSMTVQFDDAKVDQKQIIDAVKSAGYGATKFVGEDNSASQKLAADEQALKVRIVVSLALLAVIMYFSMGSISLRIGIILRCKRMLSIIFTLISVCSASR